MPNNTNNNNPMGEENSTPGQNAENAQNAPGAEVCATSMGTPMIPDEVYESLPTFMKKACSVFNGRDRDVFFTSALTTLSACFSTVTGIYGSKRVHGNLFTMIIAGAASGKGCATFGRDLIVPIHEAAMTASQPAGAADTVAPCPFILPANISSAAFMKHLQQSGGVGVMFETEIDTLTDALGQEWAGFSDILRKGFHHEPVSSSRKLNNEFLEVRNPQPAVLLTGTPGQAIKLLKTPENGLVSRFIFYFFSSPVYWKDMFSDDEEDLTEYFGKLSEDVLEMAGKVKATAVDFKLSPEQRATFKSVFEERLESIAKLDQDAISTVKRLGLIAFRIAMILSVIRMAEGNQVIDNLICSDIDFRNAMTLSGIYLDHALATIDTLPRSAPSNPTPSRFYAALPGTFTKAMAIQVGGNLGICERSVGDYLTLLLSEGRLEKIKHGSYRKV